MAKASRGVQAWQSFRNLILLIIGLTSVGPVLLLGFWNIGAAGLDPVSRAASSFLTEALRPSANSVVVGLVVGCLGLILSWWIVLRTSVDGAIVAFIIFLLFFPGLATALGLDFAVRQISQLGFTSSLKSIALIISLTGYVLPFQLIVALNSRTLFRRSELCASAELMSYSEQAMYVGKRLMPTNISMLVIGLALCFTETQRLQILGTDVAGFGSQYFGPWLVGRSQSAGIALSVFSLTAVLFSSVMLIFTLSQRRIATAKPSL